MTMEQVKTYEPADIVIYIHNKGIVLREKSLVAANWETGKIEAVGIEAENMKTKNLKGIYVVSPLRQGMIADYQMAVVLFSRLLLKALGKKPLRKPAVGICVPKGITEVEKKAVEDALIQSGAREVLIADIPVEEFIRVSQRMNQNDILRRNLARFWSMPDKRGFLVRGWKRFGEIVAISDTQNQAKEQHGFELLLVTLLLLVSLN